MAILLVIPSRFASERFPGKALVPLAGVPLVRRVAERARAAGVADRVVLSTDDPRIAEAAAPSGVDIVIDQTAYRCGSDRVAAIARDHDWADVVINLQGDEPLVDAPMLAAAVSALQGAELGTVATTRGVAAALDDPHAVKVAHDGAGRALSFSRRPRSFTKRSRLALHLGIYAFSRQGLARFAALRPSIGEQVERLEQLRALEAGWPIGVRFVDAAAVSLDVPADVARIENELVAFDKIEAASGRDPSLVVGA